MSNTKTKKKKTLTDAMDSADRALDIFRKKGHKISITGKEVVNSGVEVFVENIKQFDIDEFSPLWVVNNIKEGPSLQFALIVHIREGVKKTEWKELISFLGYTEKEFANILPSSISSMQKKEIYDKETSERIYEIARLFGLGIEVFDSKEDFKNWLITPSRTLGVKKPFELLDSSFGFELVENEIGRIKYNVYS